MDKKKKKIVTPNSQVELKQRYDAGDKTVDLLGQPSGKYDYFVSYAPTASTSQVEREKLRDDAYERAVKDQAGDYTYPYIETTWVHLLPVEKKYMSLSAREISRFYCKDYSDPTSYPKTFSYYQAVLGETGSAYFSPYNRGDEVAYSKLTIKHIITPDEWGNDLFHFKELKNIYGPKIFNYFDYIKAWEGALLYDNRQEKFSWWIQFQLEEPKQVIPQWFLAWFARWGLYPYILPLSVRAVYEDFFQTNVSQQNNRLLFTILYRVPWILRWDYQIRGQSREVLGETQAHILYLGRRVMIKWWNKFDFFSKESMFAKKGLINLVPAPTTPPAPRTPNAKELLKDLLLSIPKEELKKQFMAVLSEEEDDDSIEVESPQPKDPYEESQDPYDL